ncbi:hypothetical protein JHK87_000689 [Glycine soja]|nr:hypothetical protein JHK87_000689 [Glycine soja]
MQDHALRLEFSFKEHVAKHGESEIPVKEVIQKLMKDTVKADKNSPIFLQNIPKNCQT